MQFALLTLVMIGLWARRRLGMCHSFGVYLATVLTSTILLPLWTDRFWTFHTFVVKEVVFAVLKMAVAVEIWHWTFARFAGARVKVGLLLVAVLAVIALATAHPAGLDFFEGFTAVTNPRQQAGVLALCLVVVISSNWYRIPLHPYHRALMIGFALYQMIHVLCQTLFIVSGVHETRTGWGFELLAALEPVGYTLTLAWWARAAWRPIHSPSEIVSKLQPWAPSW